MLSPVGIEELKQNWLPHVTSQALDRLIEMLEQGSPLLIHGSFTRAIPQGCLATHIGWHHPQTSHLSHDAGIVWLSHVAGVNPATSRVIREWDSCSTCDWQVRAQLLELLKSHQENRRTKRPEESIPEVITV